MNLHLCEGLGALLGWPTGQNGYKGRVRVELLRNATWDGSTVSVTTRTITAASGQRYLLWLAIHPSISFTRLSPVRVGGRQGNYLSRPRAITLLTMWCSECVSGLHVYVC